MPTGSSVHGILQTKILEWVAISFPRGSSHCKLTLYQLSYQGSLPWWLLLLLSHFSRARLGVTPLTAAHHAPLSLGFSRQEHWSGLPFSFPMHESEKRKWSYSVMSDSVWPHRRQLTRLPRPWDSPGKNTGVGCHFLFQCIKVKSESEVAQLRLTLSNPMDCSLPGSSVHGICQARVLEWGARRYTLC